MVQVGDTGIAETVQEQDDVEVVLVAVCRTE
jgi:hypothetical protein